MRDVAILGLRCQITNITGILNYVQMLPNSSGITTKALGNFRGIKLTLVI